MLVTLRGFPPAIGVGLWYAAQVEPQLQYGEQPRRAAVATAMSDALGDVSFELSPGIEYLAFAGAGRVKRVLQSTTKGGPS